ncbi:MAG: HNH endonuclease [Chloroflexi bacterium]|nr:HNH endonuclease [Chloroflexota bacterium]
MVHLTVDHIIARSKGGTDLIDNLQLHSPIGHTGL